MPWRNTVPCVAGRFR